MAGRPVKPLALRKLEGDVSKRSKEYNERFEHEVIVDGEFPVDDPPEWLTEEALAEWKRLARRMADVGLLKPTDLVMFANYCQAAGEVAYLEMHFAKNHEYLVTDDKGRLMVNPIMRVLSQRKQELVTLAKEFGLTPAMRAKLSVLFAAKKEEEDDGYSMASLLNKRLG